MDDLDRLPGKCVLMTYRTNHWMDCHEICYRDSCSLKAIPWRVIWLTKMIKKKKRHWNWWRAHTDFWTKPKTMTSYVNKIFFTEMYPVNSVLMYKIHLASQNRNRFFFLFLHGRFDPNQHQIGRWHPMTLNNVVFRIYLPWSHLSVYICLLAVCQPYIYCALSPTAASPPLPLSLYLLPSHSSFYPHPGATAFEEIQFEILSCIFHEPNLFLYLVLRCCWIGSFIDITWERLWLYWSVCVYTWFVPESFLGKYSSLILKFNTINK